MFIKKLRIHGYRSCLDTTFDLRSDLSVLIGPNSSGKTNILNALLLLQKLAKEEPFFRQEEATGQCELKAWFDLQGQTAILTAAIDIYTDENNNDTIVSSEQSWYARDLTGNRRRIRVPLALMGAALVGERYFTRGSYRHHQLAIRYRAQTSNAVLKELSAISEHLAEMRYYSASQFTNPSRCPVSFEIEQHGRRTRSLRPRGHEKFLFDLYSSYKKTKSKEYRQFFDIVGPEGIGLVDDISFEELQTSSVEYSVRSGGTVQRRRREKSLVVPQFRIGNNNLSPNQLSEGTFKTITLLFYLITETSRILLVEEPEVCVHHGLLASIIELIKAYSTEKQMIVSTHSDFVLDAVAPENVYVVTNTANEGTKVSSIRRKMPRKELAALRSFLETEGNLGEYWRHGGIE